MGKNKKHNNYLTKAITKFALDQNQNKKKSFVSQDKTIQERMKRFKNLFINQELRTLTTQQEIEENPDSWYRIYLPYGNKYEKSYIISTLQNAVNPILLVPLVWTTSRRKLSFYVDDKHIAKKLQKLNEKIKYPDGFNMIVKVKRGLPDVVIDSTVKNKIKSALQNRYNVYGKALDLSRFHADPNFEEEFCALFKVNIFSVVLDIISENIPELQALKLDHNGLGRMNEISKLMGKNLPNLKILHLGNNNIRDVFQMDSLKMLPIVELVLEGNPLFIKGNLEYVNNIRKCFPKVRKLDGTDLETGGGETSDVELEVNKISMDENFASKFLAEYLTVFDGSCRQSLAPAYHDKAKFTMFDVRKNIQSIRQGKQNIISFLSELPATKHDFESIVLEINLTTSSMLLTARGIYTELNGECAIRSFCRKFTIVSYGTGFVVIREEFSITDPIDRKEKIIEPKETSVQSSNSQIPDDNAKQQMIQMLAEYSKMNLKYSRMCLEEANWDCNRAFQFFTISNASGAIPLEAFV